jgi:FkbM family methyltransferase
MKLILKLADIPNHSPVFLFGAGQAGANFLNLLRQFRPDVTCRGFIDSNKTGRKEGLPIIPLDKFQSSFNSHPHPLILITSLQWREIEALLIRANTKNYLIIPPRFIVPSGFDNLNRDKQSDPRQNTLSPDLFSGENRQAFKVQLDAAEALLSRPGDRTLFRILTGQVGRNQTRLDALAEFYYRNPVKRQYFDFIDYNKVDTVIEGGVADGGDTIAFLEAMPPGGKVYGFEPNIEDYHRRTFKNLLGKKKVVKIVPKALWSGNAQLYFTAAGLSSRLSEHQPDSLQSWSMVDVVSIDQFVKEKNINKVGLIKLDIEGGELEALKGAVHTLENHRPQLAVCIYHRKEHFFQVPLFLERVLTHYEYRLGHYTAGTLETVWYCIPHQKAQE